MAAAHHDKTPPRAVSAQQGVIGNYSQVLSLKEDHSIRGPQTCLRLGSTVVCSLNAPVERCSVRMRLPREIGELGRVGKDHQPK